MGRVIRAAIEQMEEAGAEVIEVEIPSLDSLVSGSGVIAHEFKWDLIDYLAATPGAPVGSLQDILDRGLHHIALERTFRTRDGPDFRDSEAYRTALAKRGPIREAVVDAMSDQVLDALIYPTMRRAPAQIGDPQRGSNCQLSASSGLPALSVPAGFTPRGLPAGLELLGHPFSDARLLSLGFAFEQATAHRQEPFSTPTLENGLAPPPVAFDLIADGSVAQVWVRFTLDVPTGALSYELDISGVRADEVHAVDIHRAGDGPNGPVIYRLSGPGVTSASGTLTLSGPEVGALRDGRLYLSVYTREHPGGAGAGASPSPAPLKWAGGPG